MARPTQFPEQNTQLQYGNNPLPCFRDGDQVISCWRPTPAEMQEIMQTGHVWVRVKGTTQPPMEVTGHRPFDNTSH